MDWPRAQDKDRLHRRLGPDVLSQESVNYQEISFGRGTPKILGTPAYLCHVRPFPLSIPAGTHTLVHTLDTICSHQGVDQRRCGPQEMTQKRRKRLETALSWNRSRPFLCTTISRAWKGEKCQDFSLGVSLRCSAICLLWVTPKRAGRMALHIAQWYSASWHG